MSTTTEVQNERLLALTRELADLTLGVEIPRPTRDDYYALMSVKNSLRDFPKDEDLNEDEETSRLRLMMGAYLRLNEMEAFYEKNGNEWADPPDHPGDSISLAD